MNAIPSGQLRHRVKIVEPITTQNNLGEPIQSDVADLGSFWVSITPLTGRQLERARGTVETVTHEIRMRYTPLLTLKRQIQFGTRIFTVNYILNEEERNVSLKVLCTEDIN